MINDLEAILAFAGSALMGLTLACVGLRGLVLRRPFLMRGPLFTLLVSAGPLSIAVPMLVQTLQRVEEYDFAFMMFTAWPLSMIAFVAMVAVQLQGFVAFGMTGRAFRDGLQAASRMLAFEYSESLSEVHIKGKDVRIEVAVHGWIGTAQMRASTPEGRRFLVNLVRAMNGHYSQVQEPVAVFACASYAVLGLGLLTTVGWFVAA